MRKATSGSVHRTPGAGMRKVMTRGRTRPASRPPTGRPPGRRDSRAPGGRPQRIPAQPPPHPSELFTERLLLVLSGQKPVHWVARHVVHTAFDDLIRLAELQPLSVDGLRPAVQRIGHYEPRPGVFEVFARVGAGSRLRALAFRLHLGEDQRWRCTAVEVG